MDSLWLSWQPGLSSFCSLDIFCISFQCSTGLLNVHTHPHTHQAEYKCICFYSLMLHHYHKKIQHVVLYKTINMINWSTNSLADNEQASSFTISPTDTEILEENYISIGRLSFTPVLLCGFVCPQIKGLVHAVLTQDEILLDFKVILLVLRLQECRAG